MNAMEICKKVGWGHQAQSWCNGFVTAKNQDKEKIDRLEAMLHKIWEDDGVQDLGPCKMEFYKFQEKYYPQWNP